MNLSSKANSSTSYNGLDLFKLFCAVLIVIIHIAPFGNPPHLSTGWYLNFWIQNFFCRIAAPFFFVASGFLLFKKTSYLQFDLSVIKKYVVRMLKLYLIWTVIYLPCEINIYYANKTGFLYNLIDHIRCTILTGSYTQLWYFPALIFAVILIAFLLSKRVKPQIIVAIAGCFYAIGLLAQSWFGLIRPLEQSAPFLWSILKKIEFVILTTRNGLFEAFLFVAIGMIIAFSSKTLSLGKALVGFVLSFVAMYAETRFLFEHNFIRRVDMYIFLVPTVMFMFIVAIQIKLPDSPVYKTVRKLSSLIFYSHLLFEYVFSRTLPQPNYSTLHLNPVLPATLLVTVVCSLIVIKLTDTKAFGWFKHLY